MPDYMPVMKHPVIVECFFKLTKYSCKYELDNKEIIDDIKKEAAAILHDIKQTLKVKALNFVYDKFVIDLNN